MKFLLLRNFLVAYGGAERTLLEQAAYLAEKGHAVHIATFTLDKGRIPPPYPCPLEELSRTGGILAHAWRLRRVVRRFEPDAVFVHENGHIPLFLATLLGRRYRMVLLRHDTFMWHWGRDLKASLLRRKKVKQILGMLEGHREFGSDVFQRLGFTGRLRAEANAVMDHLATRRANVIATLTEQGRSEIELLYGRAAEIVREGVDMSFFNPSRRPCSVEDVRRRWGMRPEDKVILTVNRLDPRKRIPLLLEAVQRMGPSERGIRLIVVGDGPERQALEETAGRLGLNGSVLFTGFVDNETLYDFYLACNVFAFPAWTGYGLGPLEALGMGKQVVVSEDAGVQEVIRRHPGVYVSRPKVEEFAAKLSQALESPQRVPRDEVAREMDNSNYWRRLLELAEAPSTGPEHRSRM